MSAFSLKIEEEILQTSVLYSFAIFFSKPIDFTDLMC